MAMEDIESGGKEAMPQKELHRERRKTFGCGRLLCSILCFIVTIFILLAILVVVLYFVLKPKAPQVTLDRIDVQSISLNSGNVSLTNLTSIATPNLTSLTPSDLNFNSNMTLYLILSNPNKVELNFKSINISVYYLNQSIGNSSIPSFTESKESSTNITSSFLSQNVPMASSVGLPFLNDFLNNSITFQLNIQSKANIEIWNIASPNAEVEVNCNLNYSPITSKINSKTCSIDKVNVG